MTNYKLLKQRLKRLIMRRLPGATGRNDGITWRIHLDMPVPDVTITPASEPSSPLLPPCVSNTDMELLEGKASMPPPDDAPEESEFLIIGGIHIIKMGEESVVMDPTDFLVISQAWKVVDDDEAAREIVRLAPVLRLSGVGPGRLPVSGEEAGVPSANCDDGWSLHANHGGAES